MNTAFNPALQQIQIPFSKNKLVLLLIVSIIFVVIGVFMLITPHKTGDNSIYNNPVFVISFGTIGSILFIATAALFITHLLDSKPGLIINDEGINLNLYIKDYIKWAEIQQLGITQIGAAKLILVYLKQPEAFIAKQNSFFKKRIMSLNYKLSGTPVSITSNSLKCGFDELYTLLNQKLNNSCV